MILARGKRKDATNSQLGEWHEQEVEREVGSFSYIQWIVFMKRIWIRMSQCSFGFMFLEKHKCTYIDHTLSYHFLTQGKFYLFSTFFLH